MMERNTLPSTISPYILEATGTGNHTSASYLTSANILDMYNAAANEPATSLAYSVYKYIKDTTANNKAFDIYVRDFQSNYWTSKNGFMDGSVGDPSNRHLAPEVSASQGAYCPWLRLLILSTYINKNPNASQDNYITIINGDSNTIKGLLNIKGNDSLCDWLIKNQSPNLPNGMHTYNENDFSKKELSGVVINQGFLDIKGTGVELGFIRSLLKDFPARQLTHDEIADINRNADYSKILYECIKNRIHSTTEDKQAIARNIG